MRGKGKLTVLIVLAAAVGALVPTSPAGADAPAGSAALREFEGTVLSKSRAARSFRLRDDGRIVRVFVTRNTRFERLSGFGAIRVGAREIEAIVRERNGRWIAVEVERSGRDDRRDDDRGGDDRYDD